MNKKSVIKTMVITMLIIMTFTSIVAFIYIITNNKFGMPKKLADDVQDLIIELRDKTHEQIIKTGKYKEEFINLIMTETTENEKTESFILEVVNVNTGKLLFITVPDDTRITMSNSLYVELQSEVPSIPQIIQMENITKQAGIGKGGLYAKKIIEDFMGITIDYYTIIPKEAFYNIFAEKDNIYVLSKEAEDSLMIPINQRKTMDYFKGLYKLAGFMSDMSYEEKCKYLEYYEGISLSEITTYAADGKHMNEAFIMDSIKLNQVIYQYLSN